MTRSAGGGEQIVQISYNFDPYMISILQKIVRFFRNKFLLTIAIFVVWIFLFDSNNLLDRIKDIRNLNQLKSDREYYIEKTTQDSLRLKELKTDNANLEKFAREQYFMKRDNEDIFVVVRKDKKKNNH